MVRSGSRAGRARRALLPLAAVAALILGPSALWVARSDRQVRREIAHLQAELHAWVDRASLRPAVRGTGAPGNAWDCYVAACAAFTQRPLEAPPEDRDAPAPPAEVVAVADAIRAGAERLVARVEPEHHHRVGHGAMFTAWTGAGAIAWCARFALRSGRTREAIERGLDGAWFGADLTRDGRMWAADHGQAVMQKSLALLGETLEIADATERRRVRDALHCLEASLPGVDGAVIQLALFAARCATEPERTWWWDRLGWQQQLLTHLRQPIDLIDTPGGFRHLERLRAAADGTWRAADAAVAAFSTRTRILAGRAGSLGCRLRRPERPAAPPHRRDAAPGARGCR